MIKSKKEISYVGHLFGLMPFHQEQYCVSNVVGHSTVIFTRFTTSHFHGDNFRTCQGVRVRRSIVTQGETVPL